MRTNSRQQSNERTSQHFRSQFEQPFRLEEIHPSHAAYQHYDGQQTPVRQIEYIPLSDDSCIPACELGESSSQQTVQSHTDQMATHFTPISCPSDFSTELTKTKTQEQVCEVKAGKEELKVANAQKRKEILVSLTQS
jgi:hypothetical protein